ncbi:MAG: hypothetical protein CMG35_03725 [Candidatus Marinimicrobia bacterium]|nr:hypothetical protein [Candidatus Neomarinimicrobiota bacterium]
MHNTLTLYYCEFCETVGRFFSKFRSNMNWGVYNDLNSLTNRQLKDIGISRSDIGYIARGGKVYRR